MANTKISDLTAFTTALTTDILAVVDLTTSTTKKITLANLKTSLSLGTGDSPTFTGLLLSGLTASELIATDASKNLVSLAVATYPSLTELTYVKGVTSAIQTQLGLKAPLTAPTFATSITGSYLTASEILITDASKNIISAPVATYPSLTELTYVKGVTSAIQTQFTNKAATDQTMYIGTTAVAINRASAALTLAGITLTTPDIGTPSAGTLTNCTGLPVAGLVALTASEIVGTTAGGVLTSLAVATYPSLTELTYVKGVTSAIQTQLGTKVTSGGALGTPSSGTGTNITGIPAANILAGSFGAGAYVISTSLQAATIELGHATDTTLSRSAAGVLAVEGVVIPSISSTNTLTNKRITQREGTVADSATPTPASDDIDIYTVTALAQAATFGAPTGTPTQGQKLIIRIKDNGTARALSFNAIYRAGTDVALPTTTVLSKTLYLGFIYNSTDTKWDLLAKVNNI